MSPRLAPYAELQCLSNFSFLRGASHPEELVARAADLGYEALALTDIASLAGVVRAHVAAGEQGIQLIMGSQLEVGCRFTLILLAATRIGYENLSTLITRGRRRAHKGTYQLHRPDVASHAQGLLALWVPLLPLDPSEEGDIRGTADWLHAHFPGRAWIAASLHRDGQDRRRREALEALSRETGLPLVATGDVHMHVRGRRALQDALTAIRLGRPLAQVGEALFPNGERHLRSRQALTGLYPRSWLERTVEIARRCRFSLDMLRYEYPLDDVPKDLSPDRYLRRLVEDGMTRHWPEGAPARVCHLVDHELGVIRDMGYEPYFLTVHDIVRFARGRGILCQGRGSAANSAVCFCLGITSVDPAHSEMLFERFISRERNEPPDIDVDFEHERREEVIQYIYTRYGRDRAALAATVITYRRRSAIRDLGKALGLAQAQVDRLAANMAWWESGVDEDRVREAGLDPHSAVMRRLLTLVGQIRGFPRHLSQHVGGFVISRGPLSHLVPLENAAMEDRTIIQWDKDDLDAVGLLKIDVLALGMLSAVRRSFDLIQAYRGEQLNLATVPREDPAVYRMIQQADTVGVFQIESRAQMSMLPRLRPACFYDLVIEVAIVRPGPIQGEMVHPYLRRRQGLEPVTYPSPQVRQVLERTLGVPLFQEQVIKLAMVAAGFSAGEADGLRRAIGAWRRKGTLDRFRERLLEGMAARGYDPDFARQIYQQILGFGEYGFPESHAASFALIAYVSAWLKCHEPAAFTAALLNSQPMGFYGPSQLIQDARRHGVQVLPVDVCASDWDCTLLPLDDEAGHGAEDITQPALRLGLRLIRGLSRATADRIVDARRARAFVAATDLSQRAQLHRKDMDTLAAAGALASLSGHRHRARWEALATETPLPLLADACVREADPLLRVPSEGEDLVADYASQGLSLGRHPLALLRERLAGLGPATARSLQAQPHRRQVRYVGLVITRQHPSSASGTVFLTLEDETGTVNIIVWPALVIRFRAEVLQGRLLEVRGEWQREDGVCHLVARHLKDRSAWLGALPTDSRDFC
ncbi:error-prone DNA polymerase [Ectothiorhodospira haloalkaliphila]|uniref:error-prone DNA polymerase n=1 Tax=Ectothiorhodospira haloalkaliphila TaxID=421628 RepID=UPI001EE8A5F1|nr:error-prone DNA polymerase [Ectothiorhodospira haloalkaliphila]MCG5524822.1 error-prone DNA polymerase [Ectothiorhodospira haloalkaliphila]